jgi:hypothetical protein
LTLCARDPWLKTIIASSISKCDIDIDKIPSAALTQHLDSPLGMDLAHAQQRTGKLDGSVDFASHLIYKEVDCPDRVWPLPLRATGHSRPIELLHYVGLVEAPLHHLTLAQWPAGSLPIFVAVLDLYPPQSATLQIVLSHLLMNRNAEGVNMYFKHGVPLRSVTVGTSIQH